MSKERQDGAFGLKHAFYILVAIAFTAWALWGMGAFESKKGAKTPASVESPQAQLPTLRIPCPQNNAVNGPADCPQTK